MTGDKVTTHGNMIGGNGTEGEIIAFAISNEN
jgi:hypothetical protein